MFRQKKTSINYTQTNNNNNNDALELKNGHNQCTHTREY